MLMHVQGSRFTVYRYVKSQNLSNGEP